MRKFSAKLRRFILCSTSVLLLAASSLLPLVQPVAALKGEQFRWISPTQIEFFGGQLSAPVRANMQVTEDCLSSVCGPTDATDKFLRGNLDATLSDGCAIYGTIDVFRDNPATATDPAVGWLRLDLEDFSGPCYTTHLNDYVTDSESRIGDRVAVANPELGAKDPGAGQEPTPIEGPLLPDPPPGPDPIDQQVIKARLNTGWRSLQIDPTGPPDLVPDPGGGPDIPNPDSIVPAEDVFILCRTDKYKVQIRESTGQSNRDEVIAQGERDCQSQKSDIVIQTVRALRQSPVDGASINIFYESSFSAVKPGVYFVCDLITKGCSLTSPVVKNPGAILTVDQWKNQADPTVKVPPAVFPDGDPVCTSGSGLAGVLAWILCPLTVLMVNTVEFVEKNIILPYLTVSPLNTEPNNPVYLLWQGMRNIANSLFIIAFFVVIFSQATSIGISNYGIKRMLPRIAIAAVGINLIYFGVAFLIDAFNVFGAGVGTLVMDVLKQGGAGDSNTNPSSTQFWTIGAAALIAVLVKAGPILGWLFGLIGIVCLIVIVAIIILVVRQLLIIALVIVSPLAVVAWILPGTEQYFRSWAQLLLQLLVMYPYIVLLFAAGKILGALLGSPNYELVGSDQNASDDIAEVIRVFLQFIAHGVPLFGLIFALGASNKIMKGATGAINALANQAAKSGIAGAKNSRVGQFVGQKLQDRKTRLMANTNPPTGANRFNPYAWKRYAGHRRRSSERFNSLTGGYGTFVQREHNKAQREMDQKAEGALGGDLAAAFALTHAAGDKSKLKTILANRQLADGTQISSSTHQRISQLVSEGNYKGSSMARATGRLLSLTNSLDMDSYETLAKMAGEEGPQERDDFIEGMNAYNDKNKLPHLAQAGWGTKRDGSTGLVQFDTSKRLKSAGAVLSSVRLRNAKKEFLDDPVMVSLIQKKAATTKGAQQIMREAVYMTSNDQLSRLAGTLHGWVEVQDPTTGKMERDHAATLSNPAFQAALKTAREESRRTADYNP